MKTRYLSLRLMHWLMWTVLRRKAYLWRAFDITPADIESGYSHASYRPGRYVQFDKDMDVGTIFGPY